MTKVLCNFKKCTKCRWDEDIKSFICTADIICLAYPRYSHGGCDEGWELPDENKEIKANQEFPVNIDTRAIEELSKCLSGIIGCFNHINMDTKNGG